MYEKESIELIQKKAIQALFAFLQDRLSPLFSNQLKEHLQHNSLLPHSISWDGREEYDSLNGVDPEKLWKCLLEYCEYQKTEYALPFNGLFGCIEGVEDLLLPSNTKKQYNDLPLNDLLLETESNSAQLNRSLLKISFGSRFSLVSILTGHFAPCFCITFDKTEKRLISGSDDGSIKIWCSQTGILIHSLLGHESCISDISVTPDNSIIASCSLDSTARFWDMKSGKHLKCIAHNSSMQSIQFYPSLDADGRGKLCISSSDGFVYLWKFKIEKGSSMSQEVDIIFEQNPVKIICKNISRQQIRCCTFTQSGFRLIVGSTDGFIRMFRSDLEQSIMTNKSFPIGAPDFNLFDQHDGHVTSVHCSYRNGRFVTGSWDGTARIWAFDKHSLIWTSRCLEVYKDGPKYLATLDGNLRNKVLLVLWSFDDSKIITSSDDSIIRVWDAATGALLFRLNFHTDQVYILAAHPRMENLVLSAGWDGKIALWDISNGKIVKSFEHEGRKFNDGQFNNDGTIFALVDNLGSILIYSMGLDSNAYSLAPTEQFLPVDFSRVTLDSENNPLDSITLLPFHLNERQGSRNSTGTPNVVISPEYGLDISIEQSEIDSGYEKCDIEGIFVEESKIYQLEKSNKLRMTSMDIENRMKKRKRPKFEEDEQDEPREENATVNQSQLIRDFINAYDSASDEIFQETQRVTISSASSVSAESDFNSEINDLEDNADEIVSDISEFSESSEDESFRGRIQRNVARRREQLIDPNRPLLPHENPPDWITQTKQTIIPYIPQLGDEICYFRQGHEEFLTHISGAEQIFFTNLPWIVHSDLDSVVEGTVTSIEYMIGPPTFVRLQISYAGRRRRDSLQNITVSYYDHPDSVDFIILRERYRESQSRFNLSTGTHVKVLFAADEIYEGVITKSEPINEAFPESPWRKFTIHWADNSNDDDSKCSPWELLRLREQLRYPSSFTLFETNCESLILSLSEEFPIFKEPVDFNEYPIYARIIAYPICLNIISERLKNSYYRTFEHFQFECKLIILNAKKFNQPGSFIFRQATEVGKLLDNFFESLNSSTDSGYSSYQEESNDDYPPVGNSQISLRKRRRSSFKNTPERSTRSSKRLRGNNFTIDSD